MNTARPYGIIVGGLTHSRCEVREMAARVGNQTAMLMVKTLELGTKT